MQTIESKMTYQEFKERFDKSVCGAVEKFVATGFYLKYARDTNILAESTYRTMAELAKAEYGMDKSMTSRFIAINDRFSEGGYSDELQEQYRGYGHTKLSLMLTLPDEINHLLSPAYSKSEIQDIKDEVDAERAVTDLEVMMEDGQDRAVGEGILNMLIRQLGEDSPDLYVQMIRSRTMALTGTEWARAAKEIMAPNGEKQYSIRISGIGRYLVSIRDTEDTITATSLRTMEQHTYDYPALMEAWEEILPPDNGTPETAWTEKQIITGWEDEYDREYPKKAEVAPVQQKKSAKTELKRKESKVQKAPVPPKEKTPAPAPAADNETVTNGHELEEKPMATGTEAAGQPPQEPETAEQPMQESESTPQEPEKPGETSAEQAEEQLPGQIGIEEAIEEVEARNAAGPYIEPDNPAMAAGGEIDEELDLQWTKIKNTINLYMESGSLNERLYNISPAALRTLRKDLIKMAIVVRKELRRRGERY